jgi:hypothetical protein
VGQKSQYQAKPQDESGWSYFTSIKQSRPKTRMRVKARWRITQDYPQEVANRRHKREIWASNIPGDGYLNRISFAAITSGTSRGDFSG